MKKNIKMHNNKQIRANTHSYSHILLALIFWIRRLFFVFESFFTLSFFLSLSLFLSLVTYERMKCANLLHFVVMYCCFIIVAIAVLIYAPTLQWKWNARYNAKSET